MSIDYKITKEENHWTSDEKIKWLGYGEWVEEADAIELEYLGYKAKVIRVMKREPYCPQEAYFGGHLCGYVVIPATHPFFGQKGKARELDCHGGITFDEPHEEHWVGFDCGHSGDYIPTLEKMRNKEINELYPTPEGFEKFALFNPSYRNTQYCIEELIGMIDQLQKFSATTKIEKNDH